MFTYTETETMSTSGAASEEHFVNMTTFPFQCTCACLFDTAFGRCRKSFCRWCCPLVVQPMVLLLAKWFATGSVRCVYEVEAHLLSSPQRKCDMVFLDPMYS